MKLRFNLEWLMGNRKSPPASSEAAQKRMKATKGRDTKPELAVRSALHRLGYRYKVDVAPLPSLRRRADLVFSRQRLAVYIDGCYWHGCPVHGTWPKANADFWRDKIETNRRRDQDTDEKLRRAGWYSLRIWEHEPIEEAVRRVINALSEAGN